MRESSSETQTRKYVYGPVPSRRLGQSLGIDPIPLKTCNWNCIYCQLGRTQPVVNARKEYISAETILEQAVIALDQYERGEIDWVTFVGSGEPLLHAKLGWMIRKLKTLTDIPIAVITNGTLLYEPEVRRDVAPADAVLPSLDAGTSDLYRKINRPHPEITFERHIDGLIAFGREYKGALWPEVMLIRGLNDTEKALVSIAAILQEIGPDRIHLNMPERPPAEPWVKPTDEEGLMRAIAILGDVASVVHPVAGSFERSSGGSTLDAIVDIITRHPMREEEVKRTIARWTPETAKETFDDIAASEKIQTIERYGVRFWCSTDSVYAESKKGKSHNRRRNND